VDAGARATASVALLADCEPRGRLLEAPRTLADACYAQGLHHGTGTPFAGSYTPRSTATHFPVAIAALSMDAERTVHPEPGFEERTMRASSTSPAQRMASGPKRSGEATTDGTLRTLAV